MNDGFDHETRRGDVPIRDVVAQLDLDEELHALALQLHDQMATQASAIEVHRPPAPSGLARHRRRQVTRAMRVAAAAALVVLVGGVIAVGRSERAPSTIATEVTTAVPDVSTTTPPPAGTSARTGLIIDAASDWRLAFAGPQSSGEPALVLPPVEPGQALIPLSQNRLTVWAAPGRATRPPILALEVGEGAHNDPDTFGYPEGSHEPTSVNGWAGTWRSEGDLTSIVLAIDDRHTVQATGWGLSRDDVARALEGATLGADLRLVLAQPPAGLVAHDLVPVPPLAPPQSLTLYPQRWSSYVPVGTSALGGSVEILESDDGTDHPALLRAVANQIVRAMVESYQSPDANGVAETVTVDGQPALLTKTSSVGEAYDLTWADPLTGRTVHITTYGVGRDATMAITSHLRHVDEATWHELVQRCPNPSAGPPTEC